MIDVHVLRLTIDIRRARRTPCRIASDAIEIEPGVLLAVVVALDDESSNVEPNRVVDEVAVAYRDGSRAAAPGAEHPPELIGEHSLTLLSAWRSGGAAKRETCPIAAERHAEQADRPRELVRQTVWDKRLSSRRVSEATVARTEREVLSSLLAAEENSGHLKDRPAQ